MASAARRIPVRKDLIEFAEELVRTGKNASVQQVVREALEEKRRAAFDAAIAEGEADIAAGRYIEGTPKEIVDGILAEMGVKGRRARKRP